MRKRILSLLLSLSMVMAIIANCTMVSAATGTNPAISIKYYSDESMQQEITDLTVDVGEYFYAAVEIQASNKVQGLDVCFGFDPSKVNLVDYNDDTNLLVIPSEGIRGDGTASDATSKHFGTALANAAGYGTKFFDLIGLPISKNQFSPYIRETGMRYVSDSDVREQEKGGLIMFSMSSAAGHTPTTSTAVALFKFKAIDDGEAAFTFPRRIESTDTRDYYASNPSTGVNMTLSGGGLIPIIAFIGHNLDVSASPLTIVRNIPKLNVPSNVQRNGRTITWDPVTTTMTGDPVVAGMISDYKVIVTATGGIGAGTYTIEGNDTTENSAQLPEGFVCGDISVTVQAVSANPLTLASGAPTAAYTDRITIDLLAPQNVKWNELNSTEVIWDVVPNASAYKVEITENGVPVTITPQTVTVNAYDFENYLNDPAAGDKNVYIVKITALGDGVYVNDDTVGATAPVKTKVGKVRDISTADWEADSKKAVWDDTNNPSIVRGYSIRLLKNGTAVTDPQEYITTTNKFYDFSSMMQEPGRYTYEVKVLGQTTSDGTYDDSSTYKPSREKIVTKKLDKVTNIQWNGKAATWESDGVHSYTIQVYKEGNQVGTDIVVTDKNYDFSSEMSSVGNYEVKIRVNGEPPVYLASDWETSNVTIDKDNHTAPTGLVWNGTVAEWDPDVNATNGYTVQLYFNGVPIEVVGSATPSKDFATSMNLPGAYTFGVKKNATSEYAASVEVISTDEYVPTVTRVGDVYVELYEDEAGTIPLTSLNVGQAFYVVISMKGTQDFNLLGVPFKFDPAKVKIIGDNNIPVADGDIDAADLTSGAKGVVAGTVLDGMQVNQAYVDNTKGLMVVAAYGAKQVSATAPEKVVTIKMIANSFTSVPTEFTFAVANDDGIPYEETLIAGFTFAMTDTPLFANISYPTPIAIGIGQLPTMAAPVWNGTDITWVKSGSPNVTSYTLELYKNGVLEDTITGITPDKDSYALATQVASVGTYKVRIKAIGDANATDSEWSEFSDEYVKVGGGGGGTSRPPKDEEPDDPDKPDGPPKPDQPEVEFNDIDGHWAEDQIKELSTYGILAGYADGSFRPNFGITRAEFTKLMVSALGYDDYKVEEERIYDDTVDHWAKDYISIGTELGFVSGIGNNLFAPDVIITREQVAAIIHRITGEVEPTSISQYIDRENITNYAKSAVDYISEKNIMIGFEDNTFRGKEQTTRAQMVIVLLKLLKSGFFEEYRIN